MKYVIFCSNTLEIRVYFEQLRLTLAYLMNFFVQLALYLIFFYLLLYIFCELIV